MRISPVLRAWAVAAAWTALIALESFRGSWANTTGILRSVLEFLFGPLRAHTFDLVHSSLRKGGHFFGYAILSFTFYRAWWTTLAARDRAQRLSWRALVRAWSWRATLLALLATLAIAGLDEWHQSFLADRGGSVRDVMLDEMGGWLAQLAVLMFTRPAFPSRLRSGKDAAAESVTSS